MRLQTRTRTGRSPRSTPTSTAESVKKMDAKIGQIVSLLEELGIAENTLIIAMADNGPMEAIHPETGQNGFFPWRQERRH